MINIVCNVSNEYSVYCRVMLTSLFETNKNFDLQVYILTCSMSEENILSFEKLQNKYKKRIVIKKIHENEIQLPVYFSYHALECYLRLFAPYILEKDIEKYIYLDCDIIINSEINDLWNVPLDDKVFAAALDLPRFLDNYKKNLNLKDGDSYINSGVMLVDSKKWRENDFTNKIITYIQHNRDKIIACDQDGINAVTQGYFKILSPIWNVFPDFFFQEPNLYQEGYDNLNQILKKPRIIHFLYNKPWDYVCNHPYLRVYKKYYKESESQKLKYNVNIKDVIKNWKKQLYHFLNTILGRNKYYARYHLRYGKIINRFLWR